LRDPAIAVERSFPRRALCKALDTPAIRWLLEHKFAEGSRFDASFPVIQACLFSGLSEKKTHNFVANWNESQCVPPRSAGELRSEVGSCAKRHNDGNPQGIAPRRLIEIRDVNGLTMDRSTAATIFRGLPRGTDFTERKRKHRKWRSNAKQAIDHATALIQSGEIAGVMTDDAVAKRLGISASTYKQRVKPELKERGLCTTALDRVPRLTIYLSSPLLSPHTLPYETACTKEESSSLLFCVDVPKGRLIDVEIVGASSRSDLALGGGTE